MAILWECLVSILLALQIQLPLLPCSLKDKLVWSSGAEKLSSEFFLLHQQLQSHMKSSEAERCFQDGDMGHVPDFPIYTRGNKGTERLRDPTKGSTA